MGYTCKNCKKPLTDPVSVALGIGPDCRMKLKAKDAKQGVLSDDTGVQFDWDVMNDVVQIHDRSNEAGGKTVTNGVEEVIEALTGYGVDLKGKRIIYRDTQGIWDEIVVAESKDNPGQFHFKAFRSINERDYFKAYEKVQRIS